MCEAQLHASDLAETCLGGGGSRTRHNHLFGYAQSWLLKGQQSSLPAGDQAVLASACLVVNGSADAVPDG